MSAVYRCVSGWREHVRGRQNSVHVIHYDPVNNVLCQRALMYSCLEAEDVRLVLLLSRAERNRLAHALNGNTA